MADRRLVLQSGLAALAAGAGIALTARADEPAKPYPNKLLTFVCPADAGGITDLITRYFGEHLAKRFGVPHIVENRPGASGSIGATHVTKRPADGYTILFGTQSVMAINSALFKNPTYDPLKDFVAVHGLTETAPMLLVPTQSPYQTAQELIAFAKANPLKLNFGSPGNGTATHLLAELFQTGAGIKFMHIPYRNTSYAMTAVISGDVDVVFDYPTAATQAMIKSGKVRPLVFTGKTRSPMFPDMPSVVELGYPQASVRTWNGFFVAAATPPAAVKRLQDEMEAVLADPATLQAIGDKLGGGTGLRGFGTAEMRTLMEREIPVWQDITRKLGITMGA